MADRSCMYTAFAVRILVYRCSKIYLRYISLITGTTIYIILLQLFFLKHAMKCYLYVRLETIPSRLVKGTCTWEDDNGISYKMKARSMWHVWLCYGMVFLYNDGGKQAYGTHFNAYLRKTLSKPRRVRACRLQ
jgi:hypothetical protein